MKTPHALLTAVALTILFSASQVSAVAFKVGGTASSADYDTFWGSFTEENSVWSNPSFYKQNQGGTEEGTYAGSFSTVFGMFKDGNTSEPLLATITWTPGFVFDLSRIWLKAGKGAWLAADPGKFNTTSYTSIELYAPAKNAISNVGLVGTARQVPDSASTLALLGLGLASLGLIARRRKA